VEPIVSVVRRWAVDWLARADVSVCSEILAPDYTLTIGGYALEGLEHYAAATMTQLERFPGLGLTVHELICSDHGVALRFTEHGADERLDRRQAAWSGVALFRWDGRRLTRGFAEEDYYSRKRQLSTGVCDPIEPPAAAPWSTRAQEPSPAAEKVVRDWLARGELSAVDLDDSWMGHDAALALEDVEVEVDELFSAGPQVAFHGTLRGRYLSGLDGLRGTGTKPATLAFAGLVVVDGDEVAGGRVIRDRLGLRRTLSAAVAP
jgi:SnoaL-like domain